MATHKSIPPPGLGGATLSVSELKLTLLRLEGVVAVLTLAHDTLMRQAADADLEVALALRLYAMNPLGELVECFKAFLGDRAKGLLPSL